MTGRHVVTFVADATPTLGAGHVMRCLTLAHALRQHGVNAVLSSSTLPPALRERATRFDVEVVDRTGAMTDGSVIEEILALPADAVVLDSYAVNPEVVDGLQQRVGVVAIDDQRDAPLGRPLAVINQNLHATPAMYADLHASSVRMLGPHFALVRSEVADWRRCAPRRHDAVLAALGGADVRGLTPSILESLRSRGLDARGATGLVLGASTAGDPDQFAQALATCRVAVIGAGTTVWECLCLGTPAIALITADNQRMIADAGVRAQLLHACFDVRESAPLDALADSVIELFAKTERRASLAKAGQRAVDGEGAARVAAVVAGFLR